MTTVAAGLGLCGLACVLLLLPGSASAGTGGYPYANYQGPGSNPSAYEWTDAGGRAISKYGYYYRNCTDFVAWKLATYNKFGDYRGLGNGGAWGSRAKGRGYKANLTPKRGSVAWWGPGKAGVSRFGHVAWVESAKGNSVTVLEYNFSRRGGFDRRKISRTSVSGFIHFRDLKAAASKPKPKDTDKDGVPDSSDRCPRKKGPKSNKGCPRSDRVASVSVGDSVGMWFPWDHTMHLRNSLSPGPSDYAFSYGASNNGVQGVPLTGDWDGDGRDSVGMWFPWDHTMHLRNSLSPGPSDYACPYGASNDGVQGVPLTGDWDSQ